MKNHSLLTAMLLLACSAATIRGVAQTTEKKTLLLQLSYFNDNNHLQYLKATAKTKMDGKFHGVSSVPVRFYIAADSPAHLLGNANTDESGEAVLFIPPAAKVEWLGSAKQSFIVVSDPSPGFEAAKGDVDILKARLRIDTAGERMVTVVLEEKKESSWTPVKGADVKIAVKRMGGNLNISDAASYTTDSTGTASGAYKLDSSLPGDPGGNIVLVASVQDNDSYGNLSAERTVRWGTVTRFVSNFDQRTLFARRGRSPYWLEAMAYTIIVVVWGILFYLLGQIRKLKRLNASSETEFTEPV